MNKLQHARLLMLDHHVQELALLLQKTRWQARALAELVFENSPSDTEVCRGEDGTCGICQMPYSSHPKVEGVHIICRGQFIVF